MSSWMLSLFLLVNFIDFSPLHAQNLLTPSEFKLAASWMSYFAEQASLKKPELRFREFIKASMSHAEDRKDHEDFFSGTAPYSTLSFKLIYKDLWILDQGVALTRISLTNKSDTVLIDDREFTFNDRSSMSSQLKKFLKQSKRKKALLGLNYSLPQRRMLLIGLSVRHSAPIL